MHPTQEVPVFPRVVWQKGCERVVQRDRKTLTVEVSHRNALGDENWMPALPDTVQDAIAQALLERLNEPTDVDGAAGSTRHTAEASEEHRDG